MRWVGAEFGLLGLVVATLAGTVCPGGPITIFPIAAAFIAIGADVGATVAFITSWTLLGYARALVWELPLLGADFVLWRIVAAAPLPLVAGLLARMIVAVRQNAHWRRRVIYLVDGLLWIDRTRAWAGRGHAQPAAAARQRCARA